LSYNIISVIKSRFVKWAGRIARMVEMRNACITAVGTSKGKRLLAKPGRGWEGKCVSSPTRELRTDPFRYCPFLRIQKILVYGG